MTLRQKLDALPLDAYKQVVHFFGVKDFRKIRILSRSLAGAGDAEIKRRTRLCRAYYKTTVHGREYHYAEQFYKHINSRFTQIYWGIAGRLDLSCRIPGHRGIEFPLGTTMTHMDVLDVKMMNVSRIVLLPENAPLYQSYKERNGVQYIINDPPIFHNSAKNLDTQKTLVYTLRFYDAADREHSTLPIRYAILSHSSGIVCDYSTTYISDVYAYADGYLKEPFVKNDFDNYFEEAVFP